MLYSDIPGSVRIPIHQLALWTFADGCFFNLLKGKEKASLLLIPCAGGSSVQMWERRRDGVLRAGDAAAPALSSVGGTVCRSVLRSFRGHT